MNPVPARMKHFSHSLMAGLLAGCLGLLCPQSFGAVAQQAYLKASNTGEFDEFGNVVAISGNTLVVGAPYESINATGIDGDQNYDDAASSGAAYVFEPVSERRKELGSVAGSSTMNETKPTPPTGNKLD